MSDKLHLVRDEFLGDLRREERRELLFRKQIYYSEEGKNSSMVEEADTKVLPELTVYGEAAQSLTEVVRTTLKEKADIDNIPIYVQALIHGTVAEQHKAAILIRKISSSEVDEGCELILRTDVLPYIVELAKRDDQPYLQIECNWTLANFCSRSEHIIRKVVEKGVIPIFLQNVSKLSLKLAEQALWGIGNLAAESSEYFELLHSHNALAMLVTLYEKVKLDNKSIARSIIWAASNLCRGRPVPPAEKTSCALQMFVEVLKETDRDETRINCVWSIRSIALKMPDGPEQLMNHNILPKLVDLLHSAQVQILQPCLGIVGHFTAQRHDKINQLVKLGIISGLENVLSTHVKSIKKVALMVLANIASSDVDCVEQILSCPSILMTVFNLATCDFPELAENSIWVLGNMCITGSFRQVERLLDLNLLGVINHVLNSTNPTESLLCLLCDSLQGICKSAQSESEQHFDKLMEAIEKEGMLEPLEALQDSHSSLVYQKSNALITEYFQTERAF